MRLAVAALVLVGACSEREAPPPAETPKTSWKHTEAERRAAIGDLSALSPELQRAFDPIDHEPMQPPKANDWLDIHDEHGQTFDEYRHGTMTVPGETRRVLYVVQLGELSFDAPKLETILPLVHAYYGLEVRTLPKVPLDEVVAKRRGVDPFGRPAQLFTPDLFTWLRPRLPADAHALIGVTMMDIYPSEDMWMLFGQASLTDRVGVVSFARFDPAFYGTNRKPNWQKVMFRRAAFTLIHEIGHTFGFSHCTHFECAYAGINSTVEMDRRPLRPCPICAHKLYSALGFDPASREESLAETFTAAGFDDEAAWATKRAKWIRTGER